MSAAADDVNNRRQSKKTSNKKIVINELPRGGVAVSSQITAFLKTNQDIGTIIDLYGSVNRLSMLHTHDANPPNLTERSADSNTRLLLSAIVFLPVLHTRPPTHVRTMCAPHGKALMEGALRCTKFES